MTDNGIETFIEAILNDRPPKHFPAGPDDTDVLRIALELRASRVEFAGPDPHFVEELHRRLATTVQEGTGLLPLPTSEWGRGGPERSTLRAGSRSRSRRMVRPRFAAVGKAAAAAALVASTFAATSLMGGHSTAPVAQHASSAATVRSGTLLTADGRPLGRTYAYSGNPSWVFMDVTASGLDGVYTCQLQLANGTTVPAGVVTVYNGTGDWAHTVRVQVSQLRRATLVTSTGITVASATFT